MRKGLFITIEGPDGAGKSTQMDFIKKYFQEKGIQTVYTREPGGTKISEKIRKLILDKENAEMSYMTEALLYAASRAQLVEEFIMPELERGKVVVCDRFVDSSIAYQGCGRDLGESVEVINSFAVQGCMPDMTLLLKLDSQKGIGRIENSCDESREKDRLESEEMTFHEKVYEGYLKVAKRFPERIKEINAEQPIEFVSRDIERELNRLIEERAYL